VYKYRSKPKKSSLQRFASAASLLAAGVTAIALVTIVPSVPSHQSNARIITQGLAIQLDRSSPAFAAMEDALVVPEMIADNSVSEPTEVVFLATGQGSAEMLAMRIMRDNRREENLLAQAKMAKEAQARLLAQAAMMALKQVAVKMRPVALPKALPAAVKAIADTKVTANRVPPAPNKPAIQHPTRTISLSELHMSREELLGSLMAPIVTAAAESSRGEVIVAGKGGLPRAVSPGSFHGGLAGMAKKAAFVPNPNPNPNPNPGYS
jgi:hypothetical protein